MNEYIPLVSGSMENGTLLIINYVNFDFLCK